MVVVEGIVQVVAEEVAVELWRPVEQGGG